MNILNDLAVKYGTDKKIPDGIMFRHTLPGHGYTIPYHELLQTRKIANMLEIGICGGTSIRMWDEYFNQKCHITGLDHSEKNANKKGLEKENIRIFVGKQDDPAMLKLMSDRNYDFIVDDGSHKTNDHIASFCGLFESMSSGGMYCIEDLQVAKLTVEIFKSVGDKTDMCKEYIPENLLSMVDRVEFYTNNKLCVIHKK